MYVCVCIVRVYIRNIGYCIYCALQYIIIYYKIEDRLRIYL